MSSRVAFCKYFVAGMILFVMLIYMGKLITLLAFIKRKIFTLLLLALFGFFMLYHLKSAAYTSMGMANVVSVLLGLWMIFLAGGGTLENFTHLKDLVSAISAGIGYALFLFFTRRLKLGFGLIPLCALLFIRSLYLSIPLFGANLNLNFSLESLFCF